jgi:hypothetical protein
LIVGSAERMLAPDVSFHDPPNSRPALLAGLFFAPSHVHGNASFSGPLQK